MPASVEVRWFFEGPIPDETERWFGRGGLLHKAAPREDHYVLFPAPLGLNVKLREGRLEIKSLMKALGARSFAADASGNVQMWEKRTGGDAAFQAFERLRTGSPALWIAVTKERTLRKFSPDGASMKEIAAGAGFLSEGCNVELTKIAAKGSDYWSLAVEAYGDPARAEESLMRVAARVLTDKHRSRNPLSIANSHSYPEWLETLKKQS